MMNRVKHIVLSGCSLVLLTQCASQDEIQNLQYQLRAVNQKLENITSTSVNQMQRQQASSGTKLDHVEDTTMRIQSSMEESNYQLNQLREQVNQNMTQLQGSMDSMRNDQDARIANLDQKVAVLEEKISLISENFTKIQQDRIKEAEKRAEDAARQAESARKRAAAATAGAIAPIQPLPAIPPSRMTAGTDSSSTGLVRLAPTAKKVKVAASPSSPATAPTTRSTTTQTAASTSTTTAAPVRSTPAASASATSPASDASAPETSASTRSSSSESGGDSFSQGMSQYKNKKYKDAYRSFEQSLASKSGDPAKTLYYMGESLYNQGEYDLAILDYQKVISNHSKNPLTPSALLKQGMSFEKLTDNETAKIIYKKLINDYGSSQEARQAKDRLDRL
ncbi:MAG: tetratricopeptide repeat protein [Desulfobulbus sp.]|jgi:tol-pal system protein YbgF